jgi:hemoglobin
MKKLGAMLFMLAACATTKPADPSPLYDRLGGKPAINAVVDGFVAKVAADKRINGYFWNADVVNLKHMLFEQICAASGGPCQYSGKDMKTAHAGMNIKEAEFGALVEDLIGAMNDLHVGKGEQKELLTTLGSLKGDVVGQ